MLSPLALLTGSVALIGVPHSVDAATVPYEKSTSEGDLPRMPTASGPVASKDLIAEILNRKFADPKERLHKLSKAQDERNQVMRKLSNT